MKATTVAELERLHSFGRLERSEGRTSNFQARCASTAGCTAIRAPGARASPRRPRHYRSAVRARAGGTSPSGNGAAVPAQEVAGSVESVTGPIWRRQKLDPPVASTGAAEPLGAGGGGSARGLGRPRPCRLVGPLAQEPRPCIETVPSARWPLLLAAATAASAQSDSVPSTDIRLGSLGGMSTGGALGPSQWREQPVDLDDGLQHRHQSVGGFQPMTDHPKHRLPARARENGRLVQVSDRSYVKHALPTKPVELLRCPNPQQPDARSPAAQSAQQQRRSVLPGAPSEIDPWPGRGPRSVTIDRGEPPVAPQDCDSIRS
jgi:hypothetical protein